MTSTFSAVPDSAYSAILPNTGGKLYIASLASGLMTNIDHSVISIEVNYSMNQASQISFDVLENMNSDYGSVFSNERTFPRILDFAENNYFAIGRDVIYETQTLNEIDSSSSGEARLIRQKQIYEISAVSVSQGPGGSPIYQVSCYTKAIQQMKRDRNPGAVKGSGSEFIKRAAQKYGLKFWGQETTKKVSITKASGDKQADSLWDVMSRIADEAKFVLFEVDGYLIFASEEYILYKWGIDSGNPIKSVDKKTKQPKRIIPKFVPLQYPAVTAGTPGRFYAMSYPTIRVSDNDPRWGDGSISVDRQNGVQLRPGMTALVGDVPRFNGYYLITSVTFADRTPNPVLVEFRKPTKEPKDILDLAVGTRFLSTDQDFAIPTIVSSRKGTLARVADYPPNIYPVPSESNEIPNNSPNIKTGLILRGNIPLYSRPVYVENGKATTMSPIIVFQKPDLTIRVGAFQNGDTCVIIPTIWTESGVASKLTRDESIDKYLIDGYFLGKLNNLNSAKLYMNFLEKQQDLLLRKYRFPNIYPEKGQVYPSTPGLT